MQGLTFKTFELSLTFVERNESVLRREEFCSFATRFSVKKMCQEVKNRTRTDHGFSANPERTSGSTRKLSLEYKMAAILVTGLS